MKTLLLEALLVVAGGAVLAFAANALSPRGLELRRNYFNYSQPGVTVPPRSPGSAGSSTGTFLEQLTAQGIRLADSNQVVALFRDPRYAQNLVAFVDARNTEEYQSGHVPNAYQFDRFHPENYLTPVLAACQLAQEVLVYCNGGSCEDSVFAALFLLSAGVPKEKLWVYPGGIAEWSTNALPMEVGERGSGQLVEQRK